MLLQFNHLGDSISFEDLKTATNLGEKTLKGVLQLLVKQKVIELKDSNYELNLKYKNKKVVRSRNRKHALCLTRTHVQIRVNLNQAIKSETKAETADVLKTVDDDRKHLIQAVIVRVMKSRKELKNQQLIQEAVAQLSQRFTPKVSDIKKQIENVSRYVYLGSNQSLTVLWLVFDSSSSANTLSVLMASETSFAILRDRSNNCCMAAAPHVGRVIPDRRPPSSIQYSQQSAMSVSVYVALQHSMPSVEIPVTADTSACNCLTALARGSGLESSIRNGRL